MNAFRRKLVVSIAALVVLLSGLGVAAQAQTTLAPSWYQQSPANNPGQRYIESMAYDAGHGQVVLFGGFNSDYANDTWLWNGSNWTNANPATVPPKRAAPAMVYDPVHGNVMMFGGFTTSSTRLNDTWLWNGTNWTNVTPATITTANSPSPRSNAGIAFDAALGEVVLFGGTNGSGLSDTWLWNGSAWTQWTNPTPASNPAPRADPGMAYDAATSQVVLFGGDVNAVDMNDTWTWNGTAWSQQSISAPPPARDAQGMDYDAALGQVVMFGGESAASGGSFLNDTWAYNGTNWTQLSIPPAMAPAARVVPNAMVYDSGLQQLVMFGGYDNGQLSDTWEFGLPGNFGNVNVCPSGTSTPPPCSKTLTFTYNVASTTTFGATQVVTQGTTGLDFTLGTGSTCSGTTAAGSCTVNVTFTPGAPGLRVGAVDLVNNSGVILATAPISGVGQGPAAAVAPGSPRNVALGLTTPYGVAVDAAGNTYITDSTAAKVLKVTPNSTTTQLGVTFTTPAGVAVDGQGNVYVADQGANVIVEVPSGCISSSCQYTLPASELESVQQDTGVAVDGAGDVFFSSLNPAQVLEIPAGCTSPNCVNVVWTPPNGVTNSKPNGIAVDAAGDLFIADGAIEQLYEVPAGCTTASCQLKVGTELGVPTGVAVDAAGDLFVSDLSFGVFEVPAGCASYGCQTAVSGGGAPYGVAVDGQGDIFVPASTNGSVIEVNRSQTEAFNFPSTNVGSTSTPESLSLQNIGNQTLSAVSPGLLVVTGPNFANVAGSGSPADCSTLSALTPGEVCNVSLTFTPQTAGNPLTSTLVFHDNSLNATSATQTTVLAGVATSTTFTIGGTISGLTGTGLVLQNNLGNNLPISGNGSFTFSTPLATGSPYSVTVLTQPSGQSCNVTNASGTVASANITNVQVSCVNLLSYALTVTEAGTGTGTVTDILGQISCVNGAGTCSGSYPGGTLVTLTATASGNSVFVGWGGACSSSGANALCIVTMNSALNVTATFVAPPPTQAGTLKPITAGVVYGQLGGFTTATKNDGGLNANALFDPDGLALDSSGNVYVSDQQNSRVLFYPAGSTTATRVYGQLGSYTSDPTNRGGISANTLSGPYGIALDSGSNLYVADYGNNRVLFYPAGSTTATRVYGQGGSFTSNSANNGGISANSLYLPTAVALDSSGNLYVVDSYNSRVLFYPAGSTTATRVYGQGGSFSSRNTGTSANGLNFPIAATLDSSGDLYVSDGNNNRVLFYPNNSTTATQVYGQLGSFTSGAANNGGVSANSLQTPAGLTVDSSGNLYVADANNGRVLFYPFGSTTATRVYGQGGSFTSNTLNNGGISANSLAQVWVPALDSNGNLYVADLGNNRVLEYGSFGNVNACPANQTTPAPCNKTVTYSYAPAAATTLGSAKVVTQGVTGLDFSFGSNACSGIISAGSSCNLNVNFTPLAPGLRAGALELFDTTGSPVATAPVYGIGQGPEIVFGPATQSIINTGTLSTPKGVLVDAAGNLFVSDTTLQQVIKIAPNGTRTTVGVGLQFPQQMAEDGAGNLYIADNNLNEIVEVPAGCTTSSCQLYLGANYRSQLGVAVDGAGDVFFGDFLDGEVVKSPAGCTSSACQTVVYNPGEGSSPVGITVDSVGNLYVADFGLRQVVEVPVGCASSACQLNIGNGFWSQPDGVAVDAAGDVFVADAGLDEIVEAPAGCTASACLGVLVSGINVVAVTLDAGGDLVFEDFVNSQVLELSRSQIPSLSFAQTNAGSTSTDSPRSINLQNIGNQPLTGSLALNLGGNFTQTASLDCSVAFPLAPGAGCIDTFSFIPQSATFLSGTAVFADNNLNGSAATQTITLSGIGATNNVAGTVAVPNVVGQTQTAASAPITSVGLTMGTVTTESSSSVASGSIISQSPAAGTQVAVGSTVNLLVSTGIALPPSPNPLSLENNYFLTGDYVSAGVTLRGTGAGGLATGTINIPAYTPGSTQGVPAGADIIDAFLYWETVENTPVASSFTGTFNGYSILGQQIGNDIPNYVDGAFTGTLRAYRADVNIYLPIGANGVRFAAGNYTVSLPDSGGTGLPLTEGASLVLIYRVLSLSPNFPLKSIVIYDGAAVPTSGAVQVVQGFYDAVGGANGTGKSTNLFASGGAWNNSVTSVTLGQSNQYTAPLNPADAYAAVILSTPVNNSDNDGILDAWKTGPTAAGDFHAGQPGYYDVKSNTWVGLPGAQHGEKDLFVQLDYMCGAVLSSGACDPTQENLFPSPDANGNDPLAMVQQAFANSGVQLHLQIGNAIPETTCVDSSSSQLCQFPNQPGVIGWKNSLEFSKLYPRNLAACLSGGDCTTRFPYGQKDSYHYVLFGHSLAIPAFNTRYATLTSINVLNGITTLVTVDRGTGINACPSRLTIEGVLGNPGLNGVYNTTGCADTKTITLATPGVSNWSYPNNTLPEPVIGITFGQTTSISGYSDLGGADSAVTLGQWLTYPGQDMSKRANVLAGTLFHEIGHTLGLSHGGLYYDTAGSYVPTFEANCKPNYQSIMNYLFQLDGVGPNQAVAFSNQALMTLNETTAGSVTSLTDGSGNPAMFPTSAWYVPYTTGSLASPATLHCDGTPLNGESGYRVDSSIAPITPAWSNGQDLSFIGTLQTQERGFNDLPNLDLRQVGATGGEFASLASQLSFGLSVSPLNISAGGNVTLGSGGTVALGSGGTVTLGSGGNVTLGSGGTVTLGSGGTVTLGSGGNVTLGSGGTVTPGSGGTVTLGSGGTVTLGSGGTITLGSGGTITLGSGGMVTLGSAGMVVQVSGGTPEPVSAGGTVTLGSGGTVTLGSGGNVLLGSGGNVTLGSGGTIALGSGGTVTLGSGGNVTLGSGGTVTLGSGGTVVLGSGGNVTLGSGGTIALGSGGTVTLGSGGNVTLGSGGTVTLGSGGNLAQGSGGNVTLGSGGTATLGAGGTVTLGSGGNVTLGSGGNVTLGSGGTIALGSGGNVTLGSGGNVTLGSGGTVTLGSGGTVTLGSGGTVTVSAGGTYTQGSGGAQIPIGGGGTVTLGSGGTVTLGSGGNVLLGSGGNITLGSGGTITLGSGGNVTLGSGGNVTLGSGGTVTLGSGGTVTLGSGGNVTLGSGGVVTLGSGGSVTLGAGSLPLGTVNSNTTGSGGPSSTELTYETANSVVRPPTSPTETPVPAGVRITWKAPAFGVVQTYTILRSSNGATPIVIGSVSGINGNPPATEFTDTNPDTTAQTVVYTIITTLVPDTNGGTSRQSQQSAPAVLKNDQSIILGPLPSSVLITSPPTITATAMSNGSPNGLQVVFSATGSCAIDNQSIASNVSSATVTLSTTGSCTVTASQPGTNAFNAANSVSGTFMVLPQGSTTKSQTITFAPLSNVQYGGTFTLSASSNASPSIPVTFTASGPCTTNGKVSAVGVCSITASAAGNSTYSAASVTQSFNVNPAVLSVTATNLTSTYGQAIPSLTYGYTGFVNNEGTSVISGTPALSTTATSTSNVGGYPITVLTGTLAATNYDFLYVGGTLTIQPANQSALTLNTTSPLAYNQSETLSVAGGTTGGVVTYNASSLCSISGAQLTANSGSGSCTVTATMAGNTNYNSVTSTPANIVTLSKASQTITFITNPPASAAYGTSFTVMATAGSGGTVSFTSAGSCSNSGATYTMTSGTGTCSVIASQSGTSNYSAAPPVTKMVSASLAAPTVTFTGAPTSAAYHSGFTVASTTNASTTAVISSSGACSNVLTAVTMTSGTGTCALTATWAADSNYSGTTAHQSTAASKAAPTVTFTGAPTRAAYQSVFTVATTTNASTTAVISSSGACSNTGTAVTMTSGTGTCALTATWAADSNYSGTTAAQSTTATLAAQTITFTTNPPASAAYTSSFTVAANGGASGNAVTFTSAGACSNSGATYTMTNSTGSCSVIANQAGNSNYAAAAQVTKTVTATGPLLSVSPSSINFGTVYFGSVSTQNITVTNIGTAPVTISDPVLSLVKGGNSNEFVALSLCPKPLAAGKSCTVTIAFLAGPFYTPQTATLQIMSNAPGSPQPVALSATVINPQASFNPSSPNFGTVKHATSSTMNVTLSNPGGTALSLTGIKIAGTNAAYFAQTNNCGSSLAAGASCTVAVKFTPAVAGTFSASLTVVDNAQAGGGTQTVALSGKGS